MIEIGAGGGSIAEIDDARPDPRRPPQRRRRSRPGLLRPRRHQADADRRQPGARLSRRRLLPRRRACRSTARRARRRSATASARRSASNAARRLGHPRDHQRGRRARLPHPRRERGFDYRALQHGRLRRLGSAARAARSRASCSIPRVIFPLGAGVMSALGLLVSPLAFEVVRSRRIHVADIDAGDFAATFAGARRRGDVAPAERRRGRARHHA